MKYYIRGELNNELKDYIYKIVNKETGTILNISNDPHVLRKELEKLNQIKILALKP